MYEHNIKISLMGCDRQRPNGLPFSRRKRATERVKKRTILRAQRSAATAGWARWPPALAGCPHDRTTRARNHTGTTGLDRNHTQHPIAPGTTGKEHHARSNHASTTGTGTTEPAQRAFPKRDRLITIKKDWRPRCPAAQRVAHQVRRHR